MSGMLSASVSRASWAPIFRAIASGPSPEKVCVLRHSSLMACAIWLFHSPRLMPSGIWAARRCCTAGTMPSGTVTSFLASCASSSELMASARLVPCSSIVSLSQSRKAAFSACSVLCPSETGSLSQRRAAKSSACVSSSGAWYAALKPPSSSGPSSRAMRVLVCLDRFSAVLATLGSSG